MQTNKEGIAIDNSTLDRWHTIMKVIRVVELAKETFITVRSLTHNLTIGYYGQKNSK